MIESEQKSALLVPIPDVASFVESWRDELDPAAKRGIPPHVTVLFPLAPPAEIDGPMIELLSAVTSTFNRFSFSFNSTMWFDERVVYLAPRPDDGFRKLSRALQAAFPQYPPYGGKYEDPLPHLTIGDGADFKRMAEAEHAIRSSLPLSVTATEVWLMSGGMPPNSWSLSERFPLNAGDQT